MQMISYSFIIIKHIQLLILQSLKVIDAKSLTFFFLGGGGEQTVYVPFHKSLMNIKLLAFKAQLIHFTTLSVLLSAQT